MTERQFRLVLGIVVLGCLYFAQPSGIAATILYLALEGVSDWRLTRFLSRVRGLPVSDLHVAQAAIPFGFEAERLLRLLAASVLFVSSFLYSDALWWLPWFIGFTMLGAGVSGVCPLLMMIRARGFK